MPKRSITDAEIALIKAMLARGFKNKDIQFRFNRPDRPVNSGRITGIRDGTYANSVTIPAAGDAKLDAFLAGDDPPPPPPTTNEDPLDPADLAKLFGPDQNGVWRLLDGETDRVECKQNFTSKHPGRWLRPIAGLANNRGGYILFGVTDQEDDGGSHRVVGMSNTQLTDIDPAALAMTVAGVFDPTPVFSRKVIAIDGKQVGIIHVEQHPGRPVIATKQVETVSEGDVFYRYPGMTKRIKYSDLRNLFDERDRQARADLLPMVARLLELGPDRAMIADLLAGELADGRRVVQLAPDVAKQLTFIKQGEFHEVEGAPTLRLVGDIHFGSEAPPIKKGLVNRTEMLEDFLGDTSRADPADYVRFAIENSHGDWLPVRHFARLAKMSRADVLALIEAAKAPESAKALYRKRFGSDDAAYTKPSGPAGKLLTRLLAGDVQPLSDIKSAGDLGRAVQGISLPLPVAAPVLKTMLRACMEKAAEKPKDLANSAVRKGIARLDELISR